MINYFYEDIDFQIDESQKLNLWVEKSILNEGKILGDLNYIFCSDDYLLTMNQDYLNHDTYTDIITFNYCETNIISGDLFISIDRVIDNAKKAKVSFIHELKRVMIHGVLHLIGYNDKTSSQAKEIRAKEDFYLALQS
ncbi:MAG: rRNA maturation RNase YbeY [Bacteroidetes bacterium]|nr:MAG: rRNA maturation RNase YbeY [Bacteroidota bacterium]MBL1143714.1 rRNA maturation RNase YbeY [Bacteroidota bacterium]MCB0801985.1 rRNA maturation RNase YbeY [Flavobacteriales bacterium]NOG56516.1 rRNA maturation RNase YbeY [Bacteroidota bacterium]